MKDMLLGLTTSLQNRFVLALAAALLLVCNDATAQTLSEKLKSEGAVSLAKAARERGSAVRGAILFPQQKLGCVKCHGLPSQQLLGPDLTAIVEPTTDVELVESLLYPSKSIRKGFETSTVISTTGKTYTGRILRQGDDTLVMRESSESQALITLPRTEIDEIVPNQKSSMPDGLVDQLADRQQLLDLARYLMEIKATGGEHHSKDAASSSNVGELTEELRGLVLLDDYKCFACHQRDVTYIPVSPKQAPNLEWTTGKIDPSYIERYIADPLHVKPGTKMPDVMASADVAERRALAREITQFLVVSFSDEKFERQTLDEDAALRGRELFHTVGCVACHSPRDKTGAELLAASSVALGDLGQKYNLIGLVAFLENPHASMPSGRMPSMKLTHWEAIDIANYLLVDYASKNAQTESPFKLDQDLVVGGRNHFNKLGCAQCHAIEQKTTEQNAPRLTGARSDEGCLSQADGPWPRYQLNESQQSAIRSAIAREPQELTDHEQILVTFETFNCLSCHQRDNLGGISGERDEYFHTTNPNLGPQGRVPPRLTGVGAKIQPKWLRQVLVSGRSIRPYMKTRMPQYGGDNVAHLVDLLVRVDRVPNVEFPEFGDQKEMRTTGHELAGTAGLNCIACHNFQQKPATTMPAVDLTEMAERLNKNWFYHYMRDPQRLSPGTIMPSFWPGGKAIRKDVLDGDADKQVEALWQYLLDGRQARPPRGLIRKPIELLATHEAVMLRRSYPGIGKRGIGVGLPLGINFAFDAEQMRLAMIWKGKFADPAGVWMSQGHGTVRPLGSDLIRFAVGPEVDDATNPWSVDDSRPPQHRFLGYSLDDLQRPTFMYRFGDIDVEDYVVDIKSDSGVVFLRRTLSFSSKQPHNNVAFRTTTDANIHLEGKGVFRIGQSLRVSIDDAHVGRIVETANEKQLRIPLDIGNEKSTLVLEYTW